MEQGKIQSLMERLKRLEDRNDKLLLRTRDELMKLYPGLPEGEFWEHIVLFDQIIAKRRRDGSIQRYAAARKLLIGALRSLQEELAVIA
jgi:hypothetical protein